MTRANGKPGDTGTMACAVAGPMGKAVRNPVLEVRGGGIDGWAVLPRDVVAALVIKIDMPAVHRDPVPARRTPTR